MWYLLANQDMKDNVTRGSAVSCDPTRLQMVSQIASYRPPRQACKLYVLVFSNISGWLDLPGESQCSGQGKQALDASTYISTFSWRFSLLERTSALYDAESAPSCSPKDPPSSSFVEDIEACPANVLKSRVKKTISTNRIVDRISIR